MTSANGAVVGATARLAHDAGEVTLAQTDKEGVALATGLVPGTWTISASAEGYEPGALASRELAAGENLAIEIKLDAGGRTLSGLVTDASGGPIGGARIDAAKLGASFRPTAAVASTSTGADGRYKLSVAEGQVLVAASEPSYAAQSRNVEIGPSGATADFQLVPGGVIEGIVRHQRTRDPVPGAIVHGQRDTPAMMLGDRGTQIVTAGVDGKFRIAGLRPGAYELDAHAPGLASHESTIVGIGVAEQVTDVEVLVASAPTIRGVVVDETGDVERRQWQRNREGNFK